MTTKSIRAVEYCLSNERQLLSFNILSDKKKEKNLVVTILSHHLRKKTNKQTVKVINETKQPNQVTQLTM